VQRAPSYIVPDCGWDQEEWAGVPSLAIAHTLTHIVDPEIEGPVCWYVAYRVP